MPDQTKDRIIDAAYRALVRRGYHETSMKDIAAEAGVAPGLAHYYFETKEDIFRAVVSQAIAPNIGAVKAMAATHPDRSDHSLAMLNDLRQSLAGKRLDVDPD